MPGMAGVQRAQQRRGARVGNGEVKELRLVVNGLNMQTPGSAL